MEHFEPNKTTFILASEIMELNLIETLNFVYCLNMIESSLKLAIDKNLYTLEMEESHKVISKILNKIK